MTACERCKGACCETLVVPLRANDPDTQRWLTYHGTGVRNGLRLECACSKLKDGRCSIYADRPQVCRTYEVGSKECREAIHERRKYMESLIVELL